MFAWAARREGLEITADMYTYTAGSTGLDAAMPPWAEDYVSDLLRVLGPWQVVASAETLSGDADDRLLECEVAPVVSATGPWLWPKTHSRMLLRNSAGQHVAAVVAGSSFGTRRALEALVRELLEQRRTDEEIYREEVRTTYLHELGHYPALQWIGNAHNVVDHVLRIVDVCLLPKR